MSRFLLVELEEDLAEHGTTHDIAMLGCKYVPGVRSVTDLSAISRVTLDDWLLPADQAMPRAQRRKLKV